MGKLIRLGIEVIILLGAVCACTPQYTGPGPAVWIDQPLDNSQLPVAPVVITAHASDQDGVGRFEFYLNDKPLVKIAGDGGILSSASTQWNPPGPGHYQVRVRGVDTKGNPGDFTTAAIQVGVLPASKTPAPAATATAVLITNTPAAAAKSDTPTPAPQVVQTTSTPGEAQGITIQARTNANCRKGPATVYEIEDVLHQDESARIEGRNQDNSWVWIVSPSVSGGHCWVAIEVGTVAGNLNKAGVVSAPPPPIITTVAPPTEPPNIITTTAPLPPAPPAVTMTILENALLNDGNPCTNHPKTTTIRADVQSSGSISQVTLNWNQNGAAGSSAMGLSGGNSYTGTLGPFANPGTVAVRVEAVDNTGQTGASSGGSVDVSSACIQ